MAYINGFKTKYKCNICGIGCRPKFNKELNVFEYEHIDNIVFINGYPSACENNQKVLKESEIEIINSPNIVSNEWGF